MAGSVNKVILVGNLVRDPEVRSMNSGDNVCNLSVATSESWNDKNTGERQERTEWHRVVIFDQRLIDVCEKYVKKGSKLYIEGQLQTRKWTDQQGIEKYSTEVVLQRFRGELTMLDSRGSSNFDSDQAISQNTPGSAFEGGNVSGASDNNLDDEIPF